MRVVRAIAATAAALCLSGAALSGAEAGTVAHATPAASSVVRIRIHHVAPIREEPGYENGTTISIRMTVRCPLGERGYALFAGLPGYFSDGRFAAPYLPGNTMPALITCTGHPQPLSTVARSVYRQQDPVTQPFETFTRSRATAVVGLHLDSGSYYTASGRIRIVDRRGDS